MTDPVTHWYLIAVIVAATVALLVGTTIRRHLAWAQDRERLKHMIFERLGIEGSANGSSLLRAGNCVEALIPASVGNSTKGTAGSGKAWLCFTQDRLLLLGQMDCHELRYSEVRRIALSDRPARGMSLLAVESEGGEVVASVGRLVDIVRVINLATKHSLPVGYLRATR